MKTRLFFFGFSLTLLLVLACVIFGLAPNPGEVIMEGFANPHLITHPPFLYRLSVLLVFLLNLPPFLLTGLIVKHVREAPQAKAILTVILLAVFSFLWWWSVAMIVTHVRRKH